MWTQYASVHRQTPTREHSSTRAIALIHLVDTYVRKRGNSGRPATVARSLNDRHHYAYTTMHRASTRHHRNCGQHIATPGIFNGWWGIGDFPWS